jgi:hypothetical protein
VTGPSRGRLRAKEAEAAARELFATLDRVRPEGLRHVSTRVDGPPVIEHLEVVGSYNLFGAQREQSRVR